MALEASPVPGLFPMAVNAVFFGRLSPGEEPDVHGVPIPAHCYSFFPQVRPGLASGGSVSLPIRWLDDGNWTEHQAKVVHYDPYKGRRLMDLPIAQVGRTSESRLLLIGSRIADGPGYYGRVVAPRDANFGAVIAALGGIGKASWPGGSAGVVPAGELARRLPPELRSRAPLTVSPRSSVQATAPPTRSRSILRPDLTPQEVLSASTGMTSFEDLLGRLRIIASRGPVRTLRAADTGVGYTLETLLGIPANVNQGGGDYRGIELKASRSRLPLDRRGPGRGSLTLMAKTPEWGPNGDRVRLLDRHGYVDANGRFGLYMSIFAERPNPQGWYLEEDPGGRRLWAVRDGSPEVYWTYASLEARIREKHRESAFITAFTQDGPDGETFLYDHLLHCSGPSLENLLRMIDKREVFVDFAIHRTETGGVRDHGFLFRTNHAHLPHLFTSVESFRLI